MGMLCFCNKQSAGQPLAPSQAGACLGLLQICLYQCAGCFHPGVNKSAFAAETLTSFIYTMLGPLSMFMNLANCGGACRTSCHLPAGWRACAQMLFPPMSSVCTCHGTCCTISAPPQSLWLLV